MRPLSRYLSRNKIRSFVISNLPHWIKPHLYRRMIKIDDTELEGLELSIATSREDLSEAFRLLHENYVRSGYMQPHVSGMRITKYHTLPSTTTIVAKLQGKVVGTVSLVRNGIFGSPVESIFDLSEYRKNGGRIAEVSSLSVSREFSGRHGKILFPLLNYLYQYSVRSFGVDYLAIAVNPTWWDFYEHILHFKRLKSDIVANYSFVNGAPAVGGILDLRSAPEVYKQAYGHLPKGRNLFEFLGKRILPGAKFPQRSFGEVSDPVMTPELFRHFFIDLSTVLEDLDNHERRALHNLYRSKKFRELIPTPLFYTNREILRPGGARHDAEFPAKITLHNGTEVLCKIKNVSPQGVMIAASRGFRHGEELTIEIHPSPNPSLALKTRIAWSTKDGISGLEISHPPKQWVEFVRRFEESLLNPPTKVVG